MAETLMGVVGLTYVVPPLTNLGEPIVFVRVGDVLSAGGFTTNVAVASNEDLRRTIPQVE